MTHMVDMMACSTVPKSNTLLTTRITSDKISTGIVMSSSVLSKSGNITVKNLIYETNMNFIEVDVMYIGIANSIVYLLLPLSLKD